MKEAEDENTEETEVGDVFDALEEERLKLKQASSEEGELFKLINSGVQNVLFFKTKLADPVAFTLSILDDIKSSREQKTKFLLRLVPIEATCKPYEDNVKESVKKLLERHFDKETSKTYSVLFKSRCNNDFTKEAAIKIVGDLVRELSPDSKVEYKTPDLVIMVEVMKGNCCLGVLPDYYGYKKYNLIELSSAPTISDAKDCN